MTGGRSVFRIEGFKHSMRTEARDPGAGAALVRQNLADRYDQNASSPVGGENQYGGARFAKDIAGTSQAETNLHAVVGALPTGAVAQPSMQDLVDVLRATGMRKPQGSATEFNRQLNHELRWRRSVQKLWPRQKQAAFPPCRPFEIERSARGSAMELRSCRNYSWHPIASIRSAPSLPGRPTPRTVTQCCGNCFRRPPKCA